MRETRQVRRQGRAHRLRTSEEVQEHLRTHFPHRSWCARCVSGCGVSGQCRRRDPVDQGYVVTVPLDCFLLKMPGEESTRVLVVRDRETCMLSAHAVLVKGAAVEWTAQLVVRDLERLGRHGRLVVRSDQESCRTQLGE